MFLIFFIFFITTFAQEEILGDCGDNCTWTLFNGSLTITGEGMMDDYDVIHYTYPPWFDNRADIETVEIEEGITTIGAFAFYGCYNLISIDIPSSVESINSNAVAFCTDLKEMIVPETVTTIMPYAFRGCRNMVKFKYLGLSEPSECTLQTFYDCQNLKSITLPSQYYVNKTTFCGQETLTSDDEDQEGICGENCEWEYDSTKKHLYIHGEGEMQQFEKERTPFHLIRGYFTNVEIEQGITSVGNYSFYNCAKINTVVLSDDIASIGSYAFGECVALNEMRIPKDIETIQEQAFVGCLNLTTVTFDNEQEPQCDDTIFEKCDKLTSVVVPSQYIYKSIDFCGKNISTENIDQEGICGEQCEWMYYANSSSLEIFGEGEMFSFEEGRAPWYLLREYIEIVEFEEGILSIGNYSFYNFDKMTMIAFVHSLSSIGSKAFENCILLTSVELPPAITKIGEQAFMGCLNLTQFKFETVIEPECPDTVFENCDKLAAVTVPSQYYVFSQDFCGKALITENTNQAGTCGENCNWSFGGNGSSTLVISGDEIEEFEEGFTPFFLLKEFVTSIKIEEGIQSIANYSFYTFDKVETVELPSTLNTIGSYAFGECIGLSQVEILSEVTLGDEAFVGCVNLTTVTYKAITQPECTEDVFVNCTQLEHIIVPSQYYVDAIDFCGMNVITENVDQEGECGEKCDWKYDSVAKSLEISGEAIENYEQERTPFSLLKEHIESIQVKEGMKEIGSYAFYGLNQVQTVELPENLTVIADHVFGECVGLSEIIIPTTVEKIGEEAFVGSTNLQTITFDNVKEPECNDNVFVNCTQLETVSIPSQYVYNSVDFCGFNNLITENKNQTGICGEKCEWNYNSDLSFLQISGEGEMYSFEEGRAPWYLLKEYIYEIEVAESISSIGTYSFFELNELEAIKIAKTVSVIGDYAFENCTQLEEVIYYGDHEPMCSNTTFDDAEYLFNVSVPFEYADEDFCGKQVAERSESEDGEEEDNLMLIVGISCAVVVGIIIIVVIIVIVVIVFQKKKRGKKSTYQALDGVEDDKPTEFN